MKLPLFLVDAFAERPFTGNPAAVCLLDRPRSEGWMQTVAAEMNRPETAFLLPEGEGFSLRWFTPVQEVDLCGHATLASAYLVFTELDPSLLRVDFETRSGTLTVERGQNGQLVMSLPSDPVAPFEGPKDFARTVGEALGTTTPAEILIGRYVLAVWPNAKDIRAIKDPGDIGRVLRELGIWGCIVTAPGDEGFDFVSRFFAPEKGVPEDPVTGSAHCALVSYWSKRLGKKTLKARQVSPRGGNLLCTDDGARTILAGSCALYMRGEIEV